LPNRFPEDVPLAIHPCALCRCGFPVGVTDSAEMLVLIDEEHLVNPVRQFRPHNSSQLLVPMICSLRTTALLSA
jgi:hypothetical protein